MSGEALRRLMAGRELNGSHEPPEDEDFVPLAFSFLRGLRERAVMFEIRHRDGRVTAFTYSWLDSATFDPSEGITLNFGRNKVVLCGRNLNSEVRPNLRLFDSILRHRVSWVQEADEPTMLSAPRNAVVIERITLQ